MRVFGSRGLVSMVVQSYVEEGVQLHMVGLVGNYKEVHHSIELTCVLEWLLFIVCWWRLLIVTNRSTITIALVCIIEWLLLMAHWRMLLPKGLIKSSWLLPSLIVPTLMHVPIMASIPYNII